MSKMSKKAVTNRELKACKDLLMRCSKVLAVIKWQSKTIAELETDVKDQLEKMKVINV